MQPCVRLDILCGHRSGITLCKNVLARACDTGNWNPQPSVSHTDGEIETKAPLSAQIEAGNKSVPAPPSPIYYVYKCILYIKWTTTSSFSRALSPINSALILLLELMAECLMNKINPPPSKRNETIKVSASFHFGPLENQGAPKTAGGASNIKTYIVLKLSIFHELNEENIHMRNAKTVLTQ